MCSWGEFEATENTIEDVIQPEVIDSYIKNAMEEENLGTVLPCTPELDNTIVKTENTTALVIDDRVIHTIKLLQHARDMCQLIDEKTKAAKEEFQIKTDPQCLKLPPAIPIPLASTQLQFKNKDCSDFSLGKGLPLPEISPFTAQKLLRKSVAALIAHAGYLSTPESILNIMTDVAEEYIKKMLEYLRIQVDLGANLSGKGFPDVMERLFHDMNIGSVRRISEYYENRIIKYHNIVLKECEALHKEYNTKINKLTDNDDLPEIHFPAVEDEDCVDEFKPSLEPGYVMLHNLEQNIHLQTLDVQEEELGSSVDVTNIDQDYFLSKKRRKF